MSYYDQMIAAGFEKVCLDLGLDENEYKERISKAHTGYVPNKDIVNQLVSDMLKEKQFKDNFKELIK